MTAVTEAKHIMTTDVEAFFTAHAAPQEKSLFDQVGLFFQRAVAYIETGHWSLKKQAACKLYIEIEQLQNLMKHKTMQITGNNDTKRNSVVDVLDYHRMHQTMQARCEKLEQACQIISKKYGIFRILEVVDRKLLLFSHQIETALAFDKILLRYHSLDPDRL